MVNAPLARAKRSRPARVVTVCISGHPTAQDRFNPQRIDLLGKVVRELRDRPEYDPIDALLFPAGYFRLSTWFGALSDDERLGALSDEPLTEACEHAAGRLARRSPGCLVVAGIDTNRPSTAWHGWGWRGDQLIAAFNAQAPVGLARKIYPVSQDTEGWGRAPFLLFTEDAASLLRFVDLANGERALLSVCYDAFLLSELAIGPTHKRRAMRYVGSQTGEGWAEFERTDADAMLAHFFERLGATGPAVHLVAIHGFKRPGGELLWQRHGLATASAALGGALTVGAAHFADSLPADLNSAPLSAFQVKSRQLWQGANRPACPHRPIAGFYTSLPWASDRVALVRLYEAL